MHVMHARVYDMWKAQRQARSVPGQGAAGALWCAVGAGRHRVLLPDRCPHLHCHLQACRPEWLMRFGRGEHVSLSRHMLRNASQPGASTGGHTLLYSRRVSTGLVGISMAELRPGMGRGPLEGAPAPAAALRYGTSRQYWLDLLLWAALSPEAPDTEAQCLAARCASLLACQTRRRCCCWRCARRLPQGRCRSSWAWPLAWCRW